MFDISKHVEFPKFLTQSAVNKQKQFVNLQIAANRQRDWFAPWDVLDDVLEEDGTVRPITQEEARAINDLADEIDASK